MALTRSYGLEVSMQGSRTHITIGVEIKRPRLELPTSSWFRDSSRPPVGNG